MMQQTLRQLMQENPFLTDFFQQNQLDIAGHEDETFPAFLAKLSPETLEERALDPAQLQEALAETIQQTRAFLGLEDANSVHALTILPGTNKLGQREAFERIELRPSDIVSIVGPTGSGKSRLLADIEWAAQGDTPTGRSIRINHHAPDPQWRYSSNNKLVAQLSQNMNFVIDVSAGAFLAMHAQSRMVANATQLVQQILAAANQLAGEPFAPETPVTSLSGGQSRALMIADTAMLSASPIVLIDEIENAGIDRGRALELLVSQDKIVLMATHDPLLALMANRRIVIQNGGVHAVLETSAEEKALLGQLQEMDNVVQAARRQLRAGDALTKETLQTTHLAK